jgi:hypothetical protein
MSTPTSARATFAGGKNDASREHALVARYAVRQCRRVQPHAGRSPRMAGVRSRARRGSHSRIRARGASGLRLRRDEHSRFGRGDDCELPPRMCHVPRPARPWRRAPGAHGEGSGPFRPGVASHGLGRADRRRDRQGTRPNAGFLPAPGDRGRSGSPRAALQSNPRGPARGANRGRARGAHRGRARAEKRGSSERIGPQVRVPFEDASP